MPLTLPEDNGRSCRGRLVANWDQVYVWGESTSDRCFLPKSDRLNHGWGFKAKVRGSHNLPTCAAMDLASQFYHFNKAARSEGHSDF